MVGFIGFGEKLLEVVSKGVGRLTKSYFDKKDIETKVYEIRKLAEARVDEIKLISNVIKENSDNNEIAYNNGQINIHQLQIAEVDEDLKTLTTRTLNRLIYQQQKKQLNVEKVVSIAASEFDNLKEMPNEPVNEDWITRFFDIAEDISDENMQFLWGRILAGEVQKPKSYSLRTLEVLRNITKEEAEVFEKFVNLSFLINDKRMIYVKNDDYFEKTYEIPFSSRLLMTELGLLVSESNLNYVLYAVDSGSVSNVIEYGNKVIIIEKNEKVPDQSIPVLVFSTVGKELAKLINIKPKQRYIEDICSAYVHPNVKISYGDMVNDSGGEVKVENMVVYDSSLK